MGAVMNARVRKELSGLALEFSHDEGVHETALEHLRIARNNGRTQPFPTIYRPSLCFIVQGEKEVMVSGKPYRYGPSRYLVTSVALPVTAQVTKASPEEPYLALVMDIQPGLVYEILASSGQTMPNDAPSREGIFLDAVNPDLTDALLRLMRTLKNENDMLILAPLVIREITYRLLNSRHGGIVRPLGVAGSQMQRIAKVIELIRRDYARPLTTREMAEAANMSPSSFHQHFKLVTTMSPLQYQKRIRLQEAKRLLSAEASSAASAGFQVGYESPSQFSREYARMFGLPPMSDIRRMRREETREDGRRR
jgi:AraC-like DNA-binding protein